MSYGYHNNTVTNQTIDWSTNIRFENVADLIARVASFVQLYTVVL